MSTKIKAIIFYKILFDVGLLVDHVIYFR